MMSYTPILNFLLSLLGAAIGVIVGMKVTIARLEERMTALNEKVDGNYELFDKRISRIEDRVLFKKSEPS